MSQSWYFEIVVELFDQYSSSDMNVNRYTSELFYSFAECYMAYYHFSPKKYWSNNIKIINEYVIYKNGMTEIKTAADNGIINYYEDTAMNDLGITKQQFDDIINNYIIGAMANLSF